MMASYDEKIIEYIKSELNSINFGSVIITIHDGKITQIDKNEKKRFPHPVKLGSAKK
ncbi:YezD family protein [Lederbergia lenta]